MAKLDCWDFKKCGREIGGAKVKELGVCPAATARDGNGVNGGQWGGRICWLVAGTLCGGEVQGTFAKKKLSCLACDFLVHVRQVEGARFKLTANGEPLPRDAKPAEPAPPRDPQRLGD